jgi:23S rRNA (uridine2552-2'-O)-methyltransferase
MDGEKLLEPGGFLSIPQTVSAYTRKDAAYRAAKRSGFRSRAALKLVELDQKFRLFKPGAYVVDLGCWPGGWLQVAAERVGTSGKVVGVDRERTDALGLPQVVIVTGDAGDPTVRQVVGETLGRGADVLLSDMAPKLSGVRVADRERHLALVTLASEWAREVLAAHGRALIKLFSEVEGDSVKVLRGAFDEVSLHRPQSTRKGSSEIYAVASGPHRSDCP